MSKINVHKRLIIVRILLYRPNYIMLKNDLIHLTSNKFSFFYITSHLYTYTNHIVRPIFRFMFYVYQLFFLL